jgi:hypothetical protein
MPFKSRAVGDMNALLVEMNDAALLLLRAKLEFEMRRRKIAFSVGDVGERLVMEHFTYRVTATKASARTDRD